jgi:hypothetical protein
MSDTPTPEEASKAHNLVKALQEQAAKRDAVAASTTTRKERAEQAYDPDAKKTRDLIRRGGYFSLPMLARDLIPFLTDTKEKHKLEEALEGLLSATVNYFAVEERPANTWIDWMGGPNGIVALPGGSVPEHKKRLVDAWHRLLERVSHLSRVGILKPPKGMLGEQTRIELLADLDETEPLKAPAIWD